MFRISSRLMYLFSKVAGPVQSATAPSVTKITTIGSVKAFLKQNANPARVYRKTASWLNTAGWSRVPTSTTGKDSVCGALRRWT